jgi:hypothetical protein
MNGVGVHGVEIQAAAERLVEYLSVKMLIATNGSLWHCPK